MVAGGPYGIEDILAMRATSAHCSCCSSFPSFGACPPPSWSANWPPPCPKRVATTAGSAAPSAVSGDFRRLGSRSPPAFSTWPSTPSSSSSISRASRPALPSGIAARCGARRRPRLRGMEPPRREGGRRGLCRHVRRLAGAVRCDGGSRSGRALRALANPRRKQHGGARPHVRARLRHGLTLLQAPVAAPSFAGAVSITALELHGLDNASTVAQESKRRSATIRAPC